MKERNKGITVISLIFILVIILIILIILNSLGIFKKISKRIDIAHKIITKQINIEEEIKEDEKLLGTTDVEGEGITISILDGKDMIHQEDVIILIDELRNCGAQAISINEQRVVSNTYLYCDGSVILIDGVKIGNPFLIKAIGNTETIYGAMTRNKGYLETLNKDGIEIKVEKSDNVKIAKTNKKELYNYKNKINLEKILTLRELVGKSDMIGSGVQIVIEENKTRLTALSFMQIVNDLNSAGAKAISINGNRITNMTDIMDISKTYVLINSIPVEGPYIINVIGNKNKIQEALGYNNSYVNKLRSKGDNIYVYDSIKVDVEEYVHKKDQDKMLINYLN